MKKVLLSILLVVSFLLLTSCGDKTEAPLPSATLTLEEELAMQTMSPEFQAALDALNQNAPNHPPTPASALDPSATDYREIAPITISPLIDWDLSRLSTTMAFGQLTHMLMYPETYVGKTVRMKGVYRPAPDSEGNIAYHFIIIYDQAACCELGIEFATSSRSIVFPIPLPDAQIELTGVFDLCYDVGEVFPCLRVEGVTLL